MACELHEGIEKNIDELRNEQRGLGGRVTALEMATAETRLRFENLNDTMQQIKAVLEKIDGRISALEKKPMKLWEAATTAIITAIVSAVVMYFTMGGRLTP